MVGEEGVRHGDGREPVDAVAQPERAVTARARARASCGLGFPLPFVVYTIPRRIPVPLSLTLPYHVVAICCHHFLPFTTLLFGNARAQMSSRGVLLSLFSCSRGSRATNKGGWGPPTAPCAPKDRHGVSPATPRTRSRQRLRVRSSRTGTRLRRASTKPVPSRVSSGGSASRSSARGASTSAASVETVGARSRWWRRGQFKGNLDPEQSHEARESERGGKWTRTEPASTL